MLKLFTNKFIHNISILFILTFAIDVSGQQNQRIRIEGNVIDPSSSSATFNLMIINKRTQHGFFGDPSGTFSLYAEKSDTIMIGAVGYKTLLFSLKDSVYKDIYNLTFEVEKLKIELRTLEVFSKRELTEIQKDIQKLGYEKSDYQLTGIDAIESPITFLYQAFSKRERHRRQVAEWENEENKRNLLKELLGKYVDGGIIKLNDYQFDEFIDFAAVSEDFMKASKQYDFIMYIKKRFEIYTLMKK